MVDRGRRHATRVFRPNLTHRRRAALVAEGLGDAVLGVLFAVAYALVIVRSGNWIVYFGGSDFWFAVWVFAWLVAGIAAMIVVLVRWTGVSSASRGGER